MLRMQLFRSAVRFAAIALALSGLLSSCDSGDIYEKEVVEEGEGFNVTGSFTLSGTEVFPEKYLLLFGAFGEEKAEPLASTGLVKPAEEGSPVTISLSNVPRKATTLRLCLTTLGKQPIYSFFTLEIDGERTSDIEIPETGVNLMTYARIQEQIFQNANCISCHGTVSGAAGLRLGSGYSYTYLVGQQATNSPKRRVEPGNVDESFLIDVLTVPNLLSLPHTSFLAKEEDLSLLKKWIESGAKEE